MPQPTLAVLVKKRWCGGNLEPGDKARLPAEFARGLVRLGCVEILTPVPEVVVQSPPPVTVLEPLVVTQAVDAAPAPVHAPEPAAPPHVEPRRKRR